MGIVTPLDFGAYLDAAIARNVDEFSFAPDGSMAVKFARKPGPVVEERGNKEPDAPPSQLEMLGRPISAPAADVFMLPGDEKPTDAAPTTVGWATERPEKE